MINTREHIKHSNNFLAGIIISMISMLSMLPLCRIAGAQIGFFALDAALAPIIGFFSGAQASILLYALKTTISIFSVSSLLACTLHLPTLAGSLYLATEYRIAKFLLPIICMIAFIAHPVGRESFLYTCYWIPPIIIAAMATPAIFLRLLGATLTTHAVGSTLWLYTHTTSPAFWHALIGIVWLERLCFASFMIAAYYGILYVKNALAPHASMQRVQEAL